MQIGMSGRLTEREATDAVNRKNRQSAAESWIQMLAEAEKSQKAGGAEEKGLSAAGSEAAGRSGRSEAVEIYEAVKAGGENPVNGIRQAPKVPYGYLAKDGVINYNGICFVCDERTNSICLGDMSNPRDVITVALSGGGCLKVNRDNLGDLSKAVGMFSPEDLNLIMRAIARDTRIQSMKRELEDMESSVGSEIAAESQAGEGEERI